MSDAVEPIVYDASSSPKAKVVLVHGDLIAVDFIAVLEAGENKLSFGEQRLLSSLAR